MDEVWVVNASPLIALARADQLSLLEQMSRQLIVPEAVVEELLAGPADPAHLALAGGWGTRMSVEIPVSVAEWGLGRGESAVLSIALKVSATAVLDDKNARRSAKAMGVPVIGTFGVIIRAKAQGLIPAAEPIFRAMLDAGLYFDPRFAQALLESVGERWELPRG